MKRVHEAIQFVLVAYGKNVKYSDDKIVITCTDDRHKDCKVYVKTGWLQKTLVFHCRIDNLHYSDFEYKEVAYGEWTHYVTALAQRAEPILNGIRERNAAEYSRQQAKGQAKERAKQDEQDRKMAKLNDIFKR